MLGIFQVKETNFLLIEISFTEGDLHAQGHQNDASVSGPEIYENCPGGEISYSIYNATSKYCFNSASWKAFEECESHSNQCCPGMSLAPEPHC